MMQAQRKGVYSTGVNDFTHDEVSLWLGNKLRDRAFIEGDPFKKTVKALLYNSFIDFPGEYVGKDLGHTIRESLITFKNPDRAIVQRENETYRAPRSVFPPRSDFEIVHKLYYENPEMDSAGHTELWIGAEIKTRFYSFSELMGQIRKYQRFNTLAEVKERHPKVGACVWFAVGPDNCDSHLDNLRALLWDDNVGFIEFVPDGTIV